MGQDRRDFLKLFGVSSAAMATMPSIRGDDGKIEEVHADSPVAPLPAPDMSHWYDVRKAQLYSALEVNPGDGVDGLKSNHQFFCYETGMPNHYATPWKAVHEHVTTADTNMQRCGSLWAPEAFLVERIGVVFSGACACRDLDRFADKYALTLWMGEKYYWRSVIAEFFDIGDMDMASPTHSLPVKGLAELKPLPLIIQNQMSFFADVQGTPFDLDSRMRMWVVLDGLHAMGVQ